MLSFSAAAGGSYIYGGFSSKKEDKRLLKPKRCVKKSHNGQPHYYIDLLSLPSQLAQVRTVGPRSDVLRSLPSTTLGSFASCVLINLKPQTSPMARARRDQYIHMGFLLICELGGLLNYSPGAWKTTNKNYGNYFQPLDFVQSHKGASRMADCKPRTHGLCCGPCVYVDPHLIQAEGYDT